MGLKYHIQVDRKANAQKEIKTESGNNGRQTVGLSRVKRMCRAIKNIALIKNESQRII